MRVRPLLKSEIDKLSNYPPEDWNLDLPKLVSFHWGHSYFHPIVAEVNEKIVGFGNVIIHGKVGWLGNIIVLPDYRRQGIGQEITSHLMDYCRSKNCASQLLIATDLGERIYRKLGFEISSTYIFYKKEPITSVRQIKDVRKVRREDFFSMMQLDKGISGEDRGQFIKRFLSTGWIYATEALASINGIYLPDFGNGLIIAKNAEAGLELMKLRLNHNKTITVVPSTNTIAREFLKSEGCQEFRTAPRMVLGNEVEWQPTMVYSRATGYCG